MPGIKTNKCYSWLKLIQYYKYLLKNTKLTDTKANKWATYKKIESQRAKSSFLRTEILCKLIIKFQALAETATIIQKYNETQRRGNKYQERSLVSQGNSPRLPPTTSVSTKTAKITTIYHPPVPFFKRGVHVINLL